MALRRFRSFISTGSSPSSIALGSGYESHKLSRARSRGQSASRGAGESSYGIVDKTIPGGRCAVLRHAGSDDTLGESIRYLYAIWLPASREEPRDFPLFLQRLRFFPDVLEHEAVSDLFLPLR